MRTLIEILLTLLAAFLAVKLGWIGALLFVLLYLVAFSFQWPFLAKRTKVTPRFLFSLALFLTVALSTRWVIGTWLTGWVAQGGIEGNSTLKFLLGSPTLVLFWSVVGGVLVTVLLAVILLLPYGLVAGPTLFSQYENYKGHEWEATMSAINILLGINRGTLVVSNGQAEMRGQNGSSLTRFGGPGILIVQEGHAVILEISGKISRSVGCGITWLKPFERIGMVVPLNGRAERVTVEQVATKDKVLIEDVAVIVFHKVDPGPEDERIQDGQFAYTERKLRSGVWSPSGDDWRNTVKSITDGAVRDVVGRYDLEQLIPMSDKEREHFKDELKQAINKVTSSAIGVLTTSVDIGLIKVPEEARKQLMEKWLADWSVRIAQSEREAMIRKGEAEAVIMKVKEVAWAQAQKQIIEEITAGFRNIGVTDGIQVPYIIALRSLETLEKMAGDPATKILLPHDVTAQLQNLRLMLQETSSIVR